MEGYKKIVFYKDESSYIKFYNNCIGKYVIFSHNGTINAIENNIPEIHTYAISALDFSYLLDKNYNIFLCENKRCGKLTEGSCELTDKEIRRGHDIRKLWIGHGFDNYFYPERND